MMPNDVDGPRRPSILILAHAFPPDPLSGAARPGRFAKYLPQFGYDPIVIAASTAAATESRADIRRVPAPRPSQKTALLAGLASLAQRYLLPYNDQLPWAVHVAAEAEAILAERPIAAVISTSPPIGGHLAALRLKRRHGLPWVADFRDPLHGNPFRSRRWPFPYDAMLERLLFRHADALVANTDALAEMWCSRHPDAVKKCSVIWNGFDPEDRIRPLPLPMRKRRTLIHVGSLYGGRRPDVLLSSLVRLVQRDALATDRFRVQFIGHVEEDCIRVCQVAVDSLRAWGCLDYDGRVLPPAQARQCSSQADYLLLLDVNDQGVGLQVPGKLFEYLQIGRPILAFTGRDSPTDRILRRSEVPCQIIYPDAGDAEVDHQVLSLFDLPPTPVPANDWFEEQFNGRNQTRKLALLLDTLRGSSLSSLSCSNGSAVEEMGIHYP